MTDASSRCGTDRARGIPQIIATEGPTFSFEFFPPRSDRAEAQLWESVRRLERLHPTFVSVTYGAGGTTRDRTVRITGRIQRETTMTTMAHLTCVGASVAQLRSVVGAYAAAGIGNIMALRGDPPGGPGNRWTAHPQGLDHADQLVALVRTLGDFTVGVAAFPDRHPESADLEQDVRTLARKARAGAAFAVTQMVTDVDAYLRLRDLAAVRGLDMPIIPGLMPVTSHGQLQRMAQLNGQPLAADVLARIEEVKHDPQRVRAEGVRICTEHASRLLREGAPGLHFITMNRSTASLEVFGRLREDAAVPSVR